MASRRSLWVRAQLARIPHSGDPFAIFSPVIPVWMERSRSRMSLSVRRSEKSRTTTKHSFGLDTAPMVSWYLHRPGSPRERFSLAQKPFARGAQGDVFDVPSDPAIVIKLYRERSRLAEYEQKINAMLAERPILP